jgi:origin recognition complex subunit 1
VAFRKSNHKCQWASELTRKPQVRSDHDNLLRAIIDSNDILSHAELYLVFGSLLASHALTCSNEKYKNMEDRKIALGLDGNEVGRVLMGEGDRWSQALAGM